MGRGVPRHCMGQPVSRYILDRELQRPLNATTNQIPGQTGVVYATAFRSYHRVHPGDDGLIQTTTNIEEGG